MLLNIRGSNVVLLTQLRLVTLLGNIFFGGLFINLSPIGSADLLRLALQKLMPCFGEKGDNINTDIKNLVAKNLDFQIQKALDTLRVIGNESVYPGQLDIKDDVSTALPLLRITNIII